jgi:AcrR family transcriptional regulator
MIAKSQSSGPVPLKISRRKAEIIDEARVLFAEKGYSGTTMRDLADAAGLLPGSLYAHFRSKSDIVRAMMIHFFGEMDPAQQAAYEGPGTGAERLAAMIRAVYDVCARNDQEIRIIHDEWKTLMSLEGLDDVLEESQSVLDRWADVVAEGIADGSIRRSIDPELLMRAVIHSIVGMIDTARYLGRPPVGDLLEPGEFLELLFLGGVATSIPPDVVELAERTPGASNGRRKPAKTSSSRAKTATAKKATPRSKAAAKKATTRARSSSQ